MRTLYRMRIRSRTVEWLAFSGCYAVRIDGKTDLEHQAFTWSVDALPALENALLKKLEATQ